MTSFLIPGSDARDRTPISRFDARTSLVDELYHYSTGECGASMVEYGFAVLVIAAVGATALSTLGGGVHPFFSGACAVAGVTC